MKWVKRMATAAVFAAAVPVIGVCVGAWLDTREATGGKR